MINFSQHPLMPEDYKSNGCGSNKARFDFVPDRIFGLSIKEPCRRHDFRYELGGTAADKEEADREFLSNILEVIDDYTLANQVGRWSKIKCAIYPHAWARHRAVTYYDAVVRGGDSSFNFKGNKND